MVVSHAAGESLEAGHHEVAIELYQAMLVRHVDDPLADVVLNNLGVSFENLARFSDAEAAYRLLLRGHPHSRLAPNAAFRVAVNAERSFRFEVALWQYADLVARFPEAPDAPLAAFNRARLLEGLERRAEAARAYRLYAERWPDSDDAESCLRRAAWLDGSRKLQRDAPSPVPAPPLLVPDGVVEPGAS
ncbi:MAG: tetratricopeptide repeat protein [Myxococcaceae bacterium]|nr:tetratricopeptide repeat protein [Myxococcaceae bacterium]